MILTRRSTISASLLIAIVTVIVAPNTVTAQKCGLLTVTVRDDDGKPIPFVDVLIYQGDEVARGPDTGCQAPARNFIAASTTDPTGAANLPAPPGTIRIRARHVSYLTKTLTVSTPTGDGTLNITLTKKPEEPEPEGIDWSETAVIRLQTGAISGRVLAPDGTPVAGVRVGVTTASAMGGEDGVSGEDGAYFSRVQLLAWETATVTAYPRTPPITSGPIPESRDVFQTTRLASVPVAPNQVTAGVDIVLKSTRYLRMTIHVADEHGAVPADAKVMLRIRRKTAELVTDESGERSVRNDGIVEVPVTPGPVEITAKAGGRHIEHYRAVPQYSYGVYDGSVRLAGATGVEVGDDPPADIYLTLMPGGHARGHVVFQGLQETPRTIKPMQVVGSGFELSEKDPNGRIARDGSFHLEGLAGKQCLNVSQAYGWKVQTVAHHGVDVTRKALTFGPSEQVDDILITLVPGTADRDSMTCDTNPPR